MSKLRKLFDMTEHPERYEDSDWMELALGHDITDEEIGREWSRVVVSKDKIVSKKLHPWLKIAASVAAILLVSGIAWAAFTGYFAKEKDVRGYEGMEVRGGENTLAADTNLVSSHPHTSAASETITYENVELQDILRQMAAHYDLQGVNFSRQELRHLRLYYEWNTGNSLEKVAEELSAFEQIKVSIDHQTLIVE